MADPRFYYYPDGAGALETVDLGEGLSNIKIVPGVQRSDAVAMDGSMSTAVYGPRFSVVITLAAFGTPGAVALERKLTTLLSHLRMGGLCGFARDHSKAWCGQRVGATAAGYPSALTGGNAFTAWSASATLASGDEVALERSPPGFVHEVRGVSSMSGSKLVQFAENQVHGFDPAYGVCWVRHRDFFPVMYLDAENAIKEVLSHEHRIHYTLTLPLMFDVAGLATLLTGPAVRTTSGPGSSVGPRGFGGYMPTLSSFEAVAGAPVTGSSLESLLGRTSSTAKSTDTSRFNVR